MLKRIPVALVMVLALFAGRVSGPASEGGAVVQAVGPARFLVSLTGAPGARDVAAANAARVHEAQPVLQLLRDRGAITGFVTNPGDGTAVVEGKPGSLRVLRRAFGADAAVLTVASGEAHAARLQAMTAAAGVSAGGGAITANYSMGGSYVNGQGPANSFIDGTISDAAGAPIARARDRSDENGYFGISFAAYQYPAIYPGFSITLKGGGATLTLKVPVLTVTGNRVTDDAKGRAPKNAAVIVTGTHYTYSASGSMSVQFPLAVLANAAGKFSVDFTPFVNMVGNDGLSVKYTYPNSANYVTYSTNLPYLYAYLDRTDIGGAGTPGPGTVTVKNRGGGQIFSMPIKVRWDGDWDDDLTNGVTAVALHPLMTLTMTSEQGVSVKLPKVTAQLKRSAKTVSGRGPANLPYAVYVSSPYGTYYGAFGSDGRYSENIEAGGPLTKDTEGYVVVYLPSGDVVYRIW